MTDSITTSDTSEVDLARQHKAWKLNVAVTLHDTANARGWCADFDEYLKEVGLPVREKHVSDLYLHTVDEHVVGEETVKEFEEWRRDASRTLRGAARRHGLGPNVFHTLEELGFPGPQQRQIQIEGTFKIPMTVEVMEGDDVITGVDEDRVRQLINQYFYSDRVTWKAVVPDEPTSEPASD